MTEKQIIQTECYEKEKYFLPPAAQTIPMQEMIQMRNINKIYNPENPLYALRNVNLKVTEGEFTAVTGPSGSGKSTLMNIMGCLDTATSGEYLLCGEKVSSMSREQLAHARGRLIGFIFQGFNLLPNYNAVENVELPLIYAGVAPAQRKKLACAALERVGLAHRLGHKPGQLSGGQQQRVAIARAVVTAPKLLLADEPTGNLDTASGREIMGLLKELNSSGSTIIMITHDLKIAAQSKRVLRIADGILSDGFFDAL